MTMKFTKSDKKYLQSVAMAAGNTVMADKRQGGVSRKEQVALAQGVALGILFVTDIYKAGVTRGPIEAASRLIACGLDDLADRRDKLLSKAHGKAVAVSVIETARKHG